MRLRTLLVWLAVVPTVAMGAQTVLTADRLLAQSDRLRSVVAAGEQLGEPLFRVLAATQAERTIAAARFAGTPVADGDVREARAATDRAAAEFRKLTAGGPRRSPEVELLLVEVSGGLDGLAAHRERLDRRNGSPESAVVYYTDVIDRMVRLYEEEFSHAEDAGLTQESRVAVSMLAAAELVSREDAYLALAGPARELTPAGFTGLIDAVGTHRYLYDTSVVPYLPVEERQFYGQIVGSYAWQAKLRIENAIVSAHKDVDSGMKLPAEISGWRPAHQQFAPQLSRLTTDRSRGLLAQADARADELESQVFRLIGASGGALLFVVVVVVFTTRSVLRRLDGLHRRTVAVAERTLPEIVDRLHRGQSVDDDALPVVRGDQDEVGRINDAFARVVAVSVDGHRQLAAERQGFGMFASGIASRTGNLVSRQLGLTEDIQDAFGHDEALLAQLMRSDQLTVGMRRQIENLLILSGGEVPDPHTEPMRIADLLREAAAEVEDFRRIERQALDEAGVAPQVISQISHLLAELLDNATRFSPPRSKVVIRAELVADGLSVEIEDRGPRVSSERYEEMNRRLHTAPPYSVLAENAHRLGLFVVGHLADRLGATVTLRRSVYGGTSAVVILPGELLVAAPPEAHPEAHPAGQPEPELKPEPKPEPKPVQKLEPEAKPEPKPEPEPEPRRPEPVPGTALTPAPAAAVAAHSTHLRA
ncbi:sensor histidine kinase, partial [Streptomyces bambusae]|uniref:sensor histidine kinase n=1 Tax=Streptomyces bambusae TaxID=1550616 RepID=UPI0027E15B0D